MPSPNVKIGAARHPEKRRNPDRPQPSRPDWLRVKAPTSAAYVETRELMRDLNLVTVCEEAACPNIGECWANKHATMMILGLYAQEPVPFAMWQQGVQICSTLTSQSMSLKLSQNWA